MAGFKLGKRKESDDRDRRGTEIPYEFLGLTGILYAVFYGKCLAECAGEDTFCSSEVNVQEEVSKKLANNDKSRNPSGRFSSSRKILSMNSVKRKLELDDEQEKESLEAKNMKYDGEFLFLFSYLSFCLHTGFNL